MVLRRRLKHLRGGQSSAHFRVVAVIHSRRRVGGSFRALAKLLRHEAIFKLREMEALEVCGLLSGKMNGSNEKETLFRSHYEGTSKEGGRNAFVLSRSRHRQNA
jgi:hypothetical protein